MYPKEYIEYLVHFHGDRDYFECHEILEEYWKKVDKNNKKSILVGFILLAVSNYHHRLRNWSGAIRTLQKSINIFHEQKEQLEHYGLTLNVLSPLLKERLTSIQNHQDYKSMNLPIQDPKLLEVCKKACLEKNFIWGQESDLTNEELVQRHSKRDRSGVIEERNQALLVRQRKGKE